MSTVPVIGARAILQRAQRRGLSLRKVRSSQLDHYWLVAFESNAIVAGDDSGLSLEEIRRWLASSGPERTLSRSTRSARLAG